jgi:thiamine biosynthesis lipoprotein
MGIINSNEKQELVQGFYFDTVNTIQSWCDRSILEEAMAQCARYHALLSKTAPGSDVWNINHAGGRPVRVSKDAMAILKGAEKISRASGGALNIALGAAVALWHVTGPVPAIPDPDALAAAVASADWEAIVLEEDSVYVPAGMQIDLGGIAKGYIADQIAGYLRDRGIESALLNFGGNVVTLGHKPDGSAWSVGLRKPGSKAGNDFWAVVTSADQSIVTSAVYERGFNLDGVWYHHILDPRTGRPVQNGLILVTAVCGDGLLADALTTALFVLGVEKGFRLAEQYDVSVLFLEDNGKLSKSGNMPVALVV